MFGYVTVSKNQLTEDEYSTFCAYYCGVCKATGKKASQLCRMGLSYDITFLAIVLSALSADASEVFEERCIAHPIKRRGVIKSDDTADYAASVGVLLTYLKMADDWQDERSVKALIGMAAMFMGYRRVKRHYPAVLDKIKKQLDALSMLEKQHCRSVDETADCFAKILKILFVPDFCTDEKLRRALAWFGYNLGRWIYIIDAFNDLEDDIKSGAYNPLKEYGYHDKETCAAEIELSLTFTLENIASAFELIDFKKNKTIIGKMIYVSLKEKQKSILSGQERNKNESIRGSRDQRKRGRGDN